MTRQLIQVYKIILNFTSQFIQIKKINLNMIEQPIQVYKIIAYEFVTWTREHVIKHCKIL